MDFEIHGEIKRTWFAGRRQLFLQAKSTAFDSGTDGASSSTFLRSLYRAFSRRVSEHVILIGEKGNFDLLTVLSHISRNRGQPADEPLRLRNMRGVPPSQGGLADRAGRDLGESLLQIRGIAEIPQAEEKEDLADFEPGVRKEEVYCEVRSFFQTFSGKGGIEYRLDYRDHFPPELRAEAPTILFDQNSNIELRELNFSTETFRASSLGMGYGSMPSVVQRCSWLWQKNKIELAFYRELARAENFEILARLPEIVEFDRALETHGLYIGLKERCVQYFAGALHPRSASGRSD